MGYSDITPNDPPAGAGFEITTAANNAQRLTAIQFQLVTTSTASNRSVVLTWTTAAGIFLYDLDVPFYQIASKSWTYSGAIGGPKSTEVSVNSRVMMSLPSIVLPPGSTITGNFNIQSDDQVTTVGYLLQDVSRQYDGA